MLYLDASVLTALVVSELRSAEAYRGIANQSLVSSYLATAEVSSAIARRVRMGEIDPTEARTKLERFDVWVEAIVQIEDIGPEDFRCATEWIR